MYSLLRLALPLGVVVTLVGCGPDYSPNSYSAAAVQQANKVDQGVIAGYREIAIKADGTVGAVTGGAAGGVLGAQAPEGGVITALSAIGGTLIGGLVGNTVEHAAGDTKAFEYIVRKPNGDLVSVAQKDTTPLPVGLKVLVIEGKQARIVADYSVPLEPAATETTSRSASKIETKTGTGGTANPGATATTDNAAQGPVGTDKANDVAAPAVQPSPPAVADTPSPMRSGGENASASDLNASDGGAPQDSPSRAEAPPVPLTATQPWPSDVDRAGSTVPDDPTPSQVGNDSQPTQ